MEKRRRGGLGCLIVILIILALIGGAVAYGFYFITSEINGTPDGAPVTVEIAQGTPPSTIAELLQETGVIGQQLIFTQYLGQSGADRSLQYGTFELRQNMGYDELIVALSQVNTERDTVSVTFPEGISTLGFAMRMEDAGLCTVEEFLDVANNGDFSQYDFWNSIPEDDLIFMKSEGYLFPNTYEFFRDSSVYDMVDKLYGEFDKQMTDELMARADEIGMTLHEVITLTSIVQREAGPVQHQADVAAVLHNRLSPESTITKLECNVSGYVAREGDNNYLYDTVAYYLGDGDSVAGWDILTTEYADMYNAYNTYYREGLPVGPICNPGLDAITNTLFYTEDSPYYFFLTDKAGTYYYAETAAEHNANDTTAWEVNASLETE